MVSIVPAQVTLYRILQVDNLDTVLNRGGLHAPNFTPRDGLPYSTIHDANVRRVGTIDPFGAVLAELATTTSRSTSIRCP